MSERLEIDFFKELELPESPNFTGLVDKILSPKGIRKTTETGRKEYALNDTLIQVYDGKPVIVEEGIYRVMVIFNNPKTGALQWNHYLVIVEEDCFYAVAEFLDCHDSLWVRDAIPYLKDYFSGETLEPIEVTQYPKPVVKTKWSSLKKQK